MPVYMRFIKSILKQLHQAIEPAQPKCLWCLESFDPESRLIDCLGETRVLCLNCLNRLDYKPKKFKIDGVRCYSLFRYDEEFSKLLIQYKEMGDVALAPIFLMKYSTWFKLKFLFRQQLLMPSSKEKIQERGFDHLELIFKDGCSPYTKLSTVKQSRLSAIERQDIHFDVNLEGIGKRVVLCDDVITTGSTLKEAIRLLGDRNIVCFTLSYVDKLTQS